MLFELKKILSNKIIMIAALLFLTAVFVYFAYCIGVFSNSGSFEYERGNELIERYAGTLTEEKYDEIIELYDIDPEEDLEAWLNQSIYETRLVSQANYIMNYNEICEQIIRSAKRIKEENELLTNGSKYTERLADKIISHYENAEELLIGDYSFLTWYSDAVKNSSFTSLPLILICIVMTAELFCGDVRTGAKKLTFTSKKGRLRLYIKKIAALCVCASVIALLYGAVQLLAVAVKYDIDINAPIQYVEAFTDCPYNISFLEFVIITTAAKILACIFVCVLTALISCAAESFTVSAISSSVICAGLYFAIYVVQYRVVVAINTASAETYNAYHTLLKFSPISLLFAHDYYRTSTFVNITEYPVSELTISVCISAAAVAAFAVLGGAVFCKKRRKCA